MPSVMEKPTAQIGEEVETPERRVSAAQPKSTETRRRPERFIRWIGWVVAVALLALGVTVVTVMRAEDRSTDAASALREARLAKEAIEEHQLAVLTGGGVVSDPSAIRLERFLWKDGVEERSAVVREASAPTALERLLEMRFAKEAIEEHQLARSR